MIHNQTAIKPQNLQTQIQTHLQKLRKKSLEAKKFYTVAVISVTDKPFFLNLCKNESAIRVFFWALFKPPESSISGSEQPDNLLLDKAEIDLIDLTLLRNENVEQRIAGIAEKEARAETKAASSRAISSSLTISIGISGTISFLLSSMLRLKGESESDSDGDSVILGESVEK